MVDAFQVEARNKDKLSDMSNLAEKLGEVIVQKMINFELFIT